MEREWFERPNVHCTSGMANYELQATALQVLDVQSQHQLGRRTGSKRRSTGMNHHRAIAIFSPGQILFSKIFISISIIANAGF